MANHRKHTVATRPKPSRTRVIVEFPPKLLSEVDAAAEESNMNRSDFIRDSVEKAAARLKKAKFEAELAEGYRANAKLDRELCHEFRFVDSEELDA